MITDGRAAQDRETWINRLMDGIAAGANMIQIREKDLAARELLDLTRLAVALAGDLPVVVNTRADVAIAAGAAGVHLPADSVAPSRWKTIDPGFLVGVSCHTLFELRAAEREGADYAIFGPVFAPQSKVSTLTPRGVGGLRSAVRTVRIPVLAIGGITHDNAQACFEAGAQGVAAITMFGRRL
ncbi:MAG: thiamine phosphate synthase [Bryobacteraceae bacterium]